MTRFATILALCAAVALFCCHQTWAQEVNATSSVVTATGRGSVTIPADIARIQLGVQADSSNASQAQAAAANASQAIVTALQALNVSELQTSSISLTQLRFPSPTPFPISGSSGSGEQIQTVFRATNIVSFEVPADQAGEAIDAAVAAGANTINSVQLIPSDNNVTTAQQEATRLAVANGIANARLVVSELGCEIVGVGNVNLSPAFIPPSSSISKSAAAATQATTPVLAGETDITASVEVNLLHSCPSAAISNINNATFPNATTTA
jgi:uncharacterized protein YggE